MANLTQKEKADYFDKIINFVKIQNEQYDRKYRKNRIQYNIATAVEQLVDMIDGDDDISVLRLYSDPIDFTNEVLILDDPNSI